jgi:hypothetical protein
MRVLITVIQTEKVVWAFLEGILLYYCFFPLQITNAMAWVLNPDFRSERPVTNRLKHGTAFSKMSRLCRINE